MVHRLSVWVFEWWYGNLLQTILSKLFLSSSLLCLLYHVVFYFCLVFFYIFVFTLCCRRLLFNILTHIVQISSTVQQFTILNHSHFWIASFHTFSGCLPPACLDNFYILLWRNMCYYQDFTHGHWRLLVDGAGSSAKTREKKKGGTMCYDGCDLYLLMRITQKRRNAFIWHDMNLYYQKG